MGNINDEFYKTLYKRFETFLDNVLAKNPKLKKKKIEKRIKKN